MMPERDVEETIKRLAPLLTDPDLAKKLDEAAGSTATSKEAMQEEEMMNDPQDKKLAKKQGGKKNNIDAVQLTNGNNSMLAQVVGIIIGSPEFQRK